jgi:hypothetical protein
MAVVLCKHIPTVVIEELPEETQMSCSWCGHVWRIRRYTIAGTQYFDVALVSTQ